MQGDLFYRAETTALLNLTTWPFPKIDKVIITVLMNIGYPKPYVGNIFVVGFFTINVLVVIQSTQLQTPRSAINDPKQQLLSKLDISSRISCTLIPDTL